MSLSVTLATLNEQENIARCLESVRQLADEIVIVDGSSTDDTVKIAKKYGARVKITDNPKIFHINKNKANDLAKGEWILQLDADEVVTPELAEEIRGVVSTTSEAKHPVFMNSQHRVLKTSDIAANPLFLRHQKLLEQRDGPIGSQNPKDPIVAYFIPRRNYFLGKFLKYGGTYPDGVIRLFKKGKARFGEKSVHDQYQIDGRVSWLHHPLLHYDSPTFAKYLLRNDRYSTLFAAEFKAKLSIESLALNRLAAPVYYIFFKPIYTFLSLYFRHKGFLDGYQGLLWALFSARTWTVAYLKYLNVNNKHQHKTTNN